MVYLAMGPARSSTKFSWLAWSVWLLCSSWVSHVFTTTGILCLYQGTITCKVGVVRRVDEVMSQGLVHVLTEVQLVHRDQVVLLAHQKHQEAFQGQVT